MSILDAGLDALAAWQRRTVCRYLLCRSDELFTLDELLTHLVTEAQNTADEVGPRSSRRDKVAYRLHHIHLPKLADADVIEYEADSRLVRRGTKLETVEPILETFDDEKQTQQGPQL